MQVIIVSNVNNFMYEKVTNEINFASLFLDKLAFINSLYILDIAFKFHPSHYLLNGSGLHRYPFQQNYRMS